MKRQIRWIEEDDDGIKTSIRVTMHGGKLRWQMKKDEWEEWGYDLPATEEQWDFLEKKMLGKYNRRRGVTLKDLEIAKRTRELANRKRNRGK